MQVDHHDRFKTSRVRTPQTITQNLQHRRILPANAAYDSVAATLSDCKHQKAECISRAAATKNHRWGPVQELEPRVDTSGSQGQMNRSLQQHRACTPYSCPQTLGDVLTCTFILGDVHVYCNKPSLGHTLGFSTLT